jgi:hypothetical protein
MSYIEELRQRVESAERRFGLIDEQERRYSERLIALMNALETAQTEKQTEAASHTARIAELERENGELRGMLHALLLGVEAGSRDTLAGTLRDLDSRLSGLLGSAPAPAAEDAVGLDTVSLGAEIEEAVAVKGAELDAAGDAPEAAEIEAETHADEEPVAEEVAAEEIMAEEIMAEEITAVDALAEESLPEDAVEEDPVAAAEQAVAALVGEDVATEEDPADATVFDEMVAEPAAQTAVDEVADEPAVEDLTAETTAEEHHGGVPPSPVAEMIVRLAEETQYFPEPEAADEPVAEQPAPKPKATRKKA